MALAIVLWATCLVPINVVPGRVKLIMLPFLVLVSIIGCLSAKPSAPRGPGMLLLVLVTVAPAAGLAETGDINDLLQVVLVGSVAIAAAILAYWQGCTSIRMLHWHLVAMGVAQALIGICQTTLGWPIAWGYLGNGTELMNGANPIIPSLEGRAIGTLAHPIPFAALLLSVLLLILTEKELLGKPFRAAVGGLLVAGIVVSGTRSVFLAALAAALIYVFASTRAHSKAAYKVTLFVMLILAIVVSADWISHAVSGLASSFSADHRLSSIRAIPNLFHRPASEVVFGTGANSNADLYERGYLVYDGQLAIDNQFVSILATGGLLGLVALFGLLLWIWRNATVSSRPVFGAGVAMFFSFDLIQWPFAWITMLVLAFASIGAKQLSSDAPVPTVSHGSGKLYVNSYPLGTM